MRTARLARRESLWLYLVENLDNGKTIDDMMAKLECTYGQARTAIHDIRLFHADDDINLVCDPVEFRERWNFRLVGTWEDAEKWALYRVKLVEGHLETITAVAGSIVKATDGRSGAGKKARKIERTLSYLQAELVSLDGEV